MFEWKERTACLSHFDANRQKEAYALPLGQKAVGHGKTIHKVHNELKLKKNAISHFFVWIVLQDAFCLFCMIIGPLCKWVGLLCWFCLVFPLVYNILTPQWIISSKDFIVSMICLYKEGLEKLKQIWLKQLLILLLTLTELRARSCITPIKILGWT